MTSVTQRVKQVTQPRGGYINPRTMEIRYLDGDSPAPVDHKTENIHASLVGMAVDYLTRLANGTEPQDAFAISLRGAELLGTALFNRAMSDVRSLTAGRVDTAAIATACRLAGYDVAFRAGPRVYNPDAQTTPDATTTQHIAVMVDRSLAFFREYGPTALDGFTFEGGYTNTVSTGDGDFLTANTLWDFKVSVAGPTSAHTLQLLMYYIMGKRSIHPEFSTITRLGVFNPRLNAVYLLPVSTVPAETIAEVARDVIGYTSRAVSYRAPAQPTLPHTNPL